MESKHLFGKINVSIWTNTFGNSDYSIHSAFSILDKYVLRLVQILVHQESQVNQAMLVMMMLLIALQLSVGKVSELEREREREST